MKIVIDARLYGLENAGIGRYVMNLINELQNLDKTNSYTLILRKKYFDQLKLAKRWRKILFDYRHYSLSEQIRLPSILRSENPNLVHFPHFNVPILYKGKFIVTIHDLLMHRQKGREATTLKPLAYYPKRIGYKKVFRHAVTRSARVIVPSKFVKNDLLGEYCLDRRKVVVIYEGVGEVNFERDENRAKEILQKYGINKDYFIYVGNAYPHKNLKRAIKAVVLLNKNIRKKGGKSTLFVIVTSRSEFAERLKGIVEGLGAQGFVKLLGFVPDDDLGTLYRNSLGFLYPSFLEGFGLPGLEAMKAGTLALTSDIPVFREVYKSKAIYFNQYDSPSIERAMRDVLEMDSKKRQGLIDEGQEFVKCYSWEKMAGETLKVYENEGSDCV